MYLLILKYFNKLIQFQLVYLTFKIYLMMFQLISILKALSLQVILYQKYQHFHLK